MSLDKKKRKGKKKSVEKEKEIGFGWSMTLRRRRLWLSVIRLPAAVAANENRMVSYPRHFDHWSSNFFSNNHRSSNFVPKLTVTKGSEFRWIRRRLNWIWMQARASGEPIATQQGKSGAEAY